MTWLVWDGMSFERQGPLCCTGHCSSNDQISIGAHASAHLLDACAAYHDQVLLLQHAQSMSRSLSGLHPQVEDSRVLLQINQALCKPALRTIVVYRKT